LFLTLSGFLNITNR